VVVVGETKRGKSSLINALVGRPGLLPVDADVATAVHLEVVHTTEPFARVFTEGEPGGVDIPLEDVGAWASVAGNPDNDKEVTSVRVGVDSPLLARGLTLIDTPGVGGLEAGHRQITLATLSLADALLFVVDAGSPLTLPELAFLEEAAERIERVLVALTKVDAHPGWEEILGEDRTLVARHASRFQAAPILAVSSTLKAEADGARAGGLDELAGKLLADSGYLELEAALLTRVVGRAQALRQANLCRTLSSVLTQAQSRERLRLRSAQGDVALDRELPAVQERCETLGSPVAAWRDQLHEEFRQLGLSLKTEIDRTATDAGHAAGRKVTEGGAEAVRSAGRDLADAIQGHWLDLNRALAEGSEAILGRVSGALGAEGSELDVASMSLPGRARAGEPAVAPPVADQLEALAGEESSQREAARLSTGDKVGRGLLWGVGLFTPMIFGVPVMVGLVAERVVNRRRLRQAAARTQAEAAQCVAESAQAAREDMRTDIEERLARVRILTEAGVEGRIIARRQEVEDALVAHRERAAAAQEERDRQRKEAEKHLGRAEELLEAVAAVRAALAR
jgi:hypothetical protein